MQSGVGRSGHFLAHESCEVSPDIVAMAKGLGNGFPIGACLATKKVAAVWCLVRMGRPTAGIHWVVR